MSECFTILYHIDTDPDGHKIFFMEIIQKNVFDDNYFDQLPDKEKNNIKFTCKWEILRLGHSTNLTMYEKGSVVNESHKAGFGSNSHNLFPNKFTSVCHVYIESRSGSSSRVQEKQTNYILHYKYYNKQHKVYKTNMLKQNAIESTYKYVFNSKIPCINKTPADVLCDIFKRTKVKEKIPFYQFIFNVETVLLPKYIEECRKEKRLLSYNNSILYVMSMLDGYRICSDKDISNHIMLNHLHLNAKRRKKELLSFLKLCRKHLKDQKFPITISDSVNDSLRVQYFKEIETKKEAFRNKNKQGRKSLKMVLLENMNLSLKTTVIRNLTRKVNFKLLLQEKPLLLFRLNADESTTATSYIVEVTEAEMRDWVKEDANKETKPPNTNLNSSTETMLIPIELSSDSSDDNYISYSDESSSET